MLQISYLYDAMYHLYKYVYLLSSIILDFERAEELKLQLLASCGPELWIMFIIDTLVAVSKLVTMLVIINVKQRLFKRYAVYR